MPRNKNANRGGKFGIVQQSCGVKQGRADGFADVRRELDRFLRDNDPKFASNSQAGVERMRLHKERISR